MVNHGYPWLTMDNYDMSKFYPKHFQSFGKGAGGPALEQVLKEGGHVPVHELLRLRIRYFSDSLALGTQPFVESVFNHHRSSFGKNRQKAGSPLPPCNWGSLHTLRDLKRRVYSFEKTTNRS